MTTLDIVEAVRQNKMVKVKDIAHTIEDFAPKALQEDYDNTGLQVGDPEMGVSAILLCLDVTEEILQEAANRQCNMIISHHPLLFKGLKEITGSNSTQRIVMRAIRENIAIYSAHTNLDSAWDGVSHEMAHLLGMENLHVLEPKPAMIHPGASSGSGEQRPGSTSGSGEQRPGEYADTDSANEVGLGVVGDLRPTPVLEFLRKVKETFNVKALRYSDNAPCLVVKKVALCGGSGASMIRDAIKAGADAFITGDVKYHDYTSFGRDILIADIGHYEGELCARQIFSRILRSRYPDIILYFAESESNPILVM